MPNIAWRLLCGPHPAESLCAVSAITMPQFFAELSLEQQQRQFWSADLWAIRRACKDQESQDILLSKTRGPSGTDVPGIVMSSEMEGSLALYAAKLLGTPGKMERGMLATKVPGISWPTFAEVLEEVSPCLEGCSEADEIALLADVSRSTGGPGGRSSRV